MNPDTWPHKYKRCPNCYLLECRCKEQFEIRAEQETTSPERKEAAEWN